METSTSIMIFTIVILVSISAFSSATEMAIASINRIRIKTKVENGNKKAKKILYLIENYDKTITSIVVINNIVNILIPTISTLLFTRLIADPALAIMTSTIIMTLLLIFFGEILPKIFGKERNEVFLYNTVNIIIIIVKLIYPIAIIFIYFSNYLKKHLFPKNAKNNSIELEEEILTMIEESVEVGELEESEEELIRNAIEFNDIRVEEILQPKRNMIMVNINDPFEKIILLIKEQRYSRLPIYEENTDNIIGVISERDFLTSYIEDKNFNLRDILRDVIFIPDTMKISILLPELQKSHSHMAIVVDERATVQGLVTTEDILEELVGEIWDEHDDVIEEFKKISSNEYEISGEMTINTFNELFEIDDIESDQAESTIAGYILEISQRIPNVGDKFEDDDFNYTISKMDGNKIDKITTKTKNHN